MTEPVKPRMDITIGGVKFNANDIAKKETKFDEQGAASYSVFLKNGVHVEYPQQQIKLFKAPPASVDLKDSYTQIVGLSHGKIEGTPQKDAIFVTHGIGNTIDISGDNNEDIVLVNDYYYNSKDHNPEKKSFDNKVIMDGKDETRFVREGRVTYVKGEGIAYE